MTPILDIAGYCLDYATPRGFVRALDAITLGIAQGEVLGLVGESGSGKTSLAWAHHALSADRGARSPAGSASREKT